jgi:hypothetical protein
VTTPHTIHQHHREVTLSPINRDTSKMPNTSRTQPIQDGGHLTIDGGSTASLKIVPAKLTKRAASR